MDPLAQKFADCLDGKISASEFDDAEILELQERAMEAVLAKKNLQNHFAFQEHHTLQ